MSMLTTASLPTPVPLLTADCPTCGLHVEQAAEADASELLRAFRTHHPLEDGRPHTGLVPDGWRVPWSSPGAWSN